MRGVRPGARSVGSRPSRPGVRVRTDVAVVVLVLVVAGPVVQVLMAHQASRLAFTAAVVDDRTVVLEGYDAILGVDFAERDGRLYSDKAPGQPFLAAPAYAAARLAGAEPATVGRAFGNLTLWWTSLWSATVPLAALAVMIRRFALRVGGDPAAATAAAVAATTGTLLLPFGTVLFGHVLAAALCFGCYLLARPHGASPGRLLAAGLVGGLAVITEYTAVIAVAVVGVLVLRRHGSGVAAYVAGGIPAAIALLAYNTAAWGSPLEFSYTNSGAFGEQHAQGLFGVQLPSPSLTAQVLLGERGLWTLTPVVLVGVAGLVALARERPTREVGVVGLVVFSLFVALQGGWFSVTAGASPGPRYVVAALPFVAVGIARAWRWSRVLVAGATLVGAIPMLMAIATNPLAQPTETFTAGHWAWRVADGRLGDTLYGWVLPDPWAHVAHLAVALVVLGVVAWLAWRDGRGVAVGEPATLPPVDAPPDGIDAPPDGSDARTTNPAR